MNKPDVKTLLIVEHQGTTRDTLAQVFRNEGYRVVAVADSQQALGHLRGTTPPHIVVLDLRGAATESQDFFEARLKDETIASVPLVLITEGQADPKWLTAPGVAGWFPKPIPIDPLVNLVKRLD